MLLLFSNELSPVLFRCDKMLRWSAADERDPLDIGIKCSFKLGLGCFAYA